MSAATLVVGLGGFGCRVVAEARGLLHEVEDPVGVEFFALDQDDPPAEVRKALEPGDFWRVPTRRVTDVLSHLEARGNGPSWRDLLSWLPAGEGFDLVDALEPGGARQYRILGRLGYFVAAKEIDRQLELAVDRLRLSAGRAGWGEELRFVLVTSAAGGTGSGILLDVAHRLRRIEPRAVVMLHLALPETFLGFGDSERGRANSFATLAELGALRTRQLHFRPCQPCVGWSEGLGRVPLFSRVFVHGRAAGDHHSQSQTARAVARAIIAPFEASLQRANRTATSPLSRLLTTPTEDPTLGHLLSHCGAACLTVPRFSLEDDCVIDFLLEDLEEASQGAAPATEPAPPPSTPAALAPTPAEPMPNFVLPVAIAAEARAWAAGLETERKRIAKQLAQWVLISSKYMAVDKIDPTRPKEDATPRIQDAFGNKTILDLSLLAKLPGFDEHLASLRRNQAGSVAMADLAIAQVATKETREELDRHAKVLRSYKWWWDWWRGQIKARLDFLGAVFSNPSFVQELGITLRDDLAGSAEDNEESVVVESSHPPPPKAVQDWLKTELERERPGLLEWYRGLGAENLTRQERRERLRSRLAGSEIETGLAEEAPLDGQEFGAKLDALVNEAAATNSFIDRTPSCRQTEVAFLLVPERLVGLEEFERSLEDFRSRQGGHLEIVETQGDRIWFYSEDLLHPVSHLKRLDDYRQAYRNHGSRQALLHIDARFLEEPDDLYRLIGRPDPPPQQARQERPETGQKPGAKPRRNRGRTGGAAPG